MTQKLSLKRMFFLSALTIGGGVSYFLNIDSFDTSSDHVPATLTTEAQKRFDNVSLTNKGDIVKKVDVTDIPATKNAPPSDATKRSRFFYDRFLHAKTAADKMDNLRWAYEIFSDRATAATTEKAAKLIGVDKAELIQLMKQTAIEFFRSSTAPPTTSRYDQMSYWNNLRLAYQYAGLTENGDYQESLSQSNTGYMYDNLVRARNSFITGAAAEIIGDVSKTVNGLQDKYDGIHKNQTSYQGAWEQTLGNMSLESKIDLRNKIYLLNYVIDRMDSSTRDEQLRNLGINNDIYDNIADLEISLDSAISNTYSEMARDYDEAPQKSPQTDQSDMNKISLLDLIAIFRRTPAPK